MYRFVAVCAVLAAVTTSGVLMSPLPALAAPSHAYARQSSPDLQTGHGVSKNWSGYTVIGSPPYTSVSASWTQPAVNCTQTPTAFASFWVGLDGWKTPTVEQTGVEAGCFEGTPLYFAWYEMYPKNAKMFPRKDYVAPGDSFTASITYFGKHKFRLTLADTTRGWSHTVNQASKTAQLGSAEVIAEAPTGGGEILPLVDFGQVSFTGASVDGNVLSSSTPGLEPLTLESGGKREAEPSALSGGAFSDTWYSE
jgi:hypothetical protein